MNSVKKKFTYGDHEVVLETGKVARQTSAAVLVTMCETTVLVAVVGRKDAKPGQDFFPLTVNYEEKTYAAGKIPGGFFKREGRPSEKETLTSRLIDRPIRPLFPKGFLNEVQVTCQVMSAHKDVDPDILAMIGTSAALALSGMPFAGPIGGPRVGFNKGGYILNPGYEALKESDLDMVVAGTESAVLMVESEAKELTEDQMLGAVLYAHQEMQCVIEAIKELKAEVGKPDWEWEPVAGNDALISAMAEQFGAGVGEAYQTVDKMERQDLLSDLRSKAVEALVDEEAGITKDDVSGAFGALEKKTVRRRIVAGEPRIDGRDTKTVRAIDVEVGMLAKAHGSALFTRGETQAIVATTLGSMRDAAIIDALQGSYKDNFLLHYNFPHYSVGETGFSGGPKRREIGHGRLARRGIAAVLPSAEDWPYTTRVVSEITESNGSSSMASVCGGCLAMMDAGVPLKAHVAGIAMGLIKEGNRFAVLTDILGDEDHLGDMDFKVAGTEEGITALQMDIKIQGITKEIMHAALLQAKEGRLHILGIMKEAMPSTREDISEHAPRIIKLKINPEKIRDVIGKGGAVIRALTEETGTTIDITDDGIVMIACVSAEGGELAKKRIEDITAEVEVGKIYEGTVLKLLDFGAIVSILPGKDGLLHISQIANERVNNVSDHLKDGQSVRVKVLEADDKGRLRLSMKAVEADAAAENKSAEGEGAKKDVDAS